MLLLFVVVSILAVVGIALRCVAFLGVCYLVLVVWSLGRLFVWTVFNQSPARWLADCLADWLDVVGTNVFCSMD